MEKDDDWRSPSFRQMMINKIKQAIGSSTENPVDMENHVFSKARTKDEYLNLVTRSVIHVRGMNGANSSQGAPQQLGIQDPINALQNFACQGTRNVQPQMGQQPAPQGIMGIQQQQQQVWSGMICPQINSQMIGAQGGNIAHQQQLNQQMQMNQIRSVGPVKVGNVGPMNQMVPDQMIRGQNVLGNAYWQHVGNLQMNPMMNQNQMNNQRMMQGNSQMNNAGMMNVRGMAPNQMMNPMNSGPQQMMNMQQMNMRNQNQPPAPFAQVRQVAPPDFLRQSPSPMSVPSPIGLSQSQHMVASPASHMVPSPQAPLSNQPQQRMGPNMMAPSPGGNMNTPGQPQCDYAQSPMNPHDDQIYRQKYKQLTKYKEPLKKVISRVGLENNSKKLMKLKKLLEILSIPEARFPLETLMKCEIVLVNQFGVLKDAGPTNVNNNPLYDAISNNLQNPLANHTIQRTFKPSLEAWFGPDIKNLPPARKRRLSEEQVVPNINEIPHILQGEIARLDSKFKITLDQTAHTTGTKSLKLICCLDDKFLPCVPPIHITIPEAYPMTSPQCNIVEHDTPFLVSVEKALKARISKLPERFSLTHVLETWTLAIRQACNFSFGNCNSRKQIHRYDLLITNYEV